MNRLSGIIAKIQQSGAILLVDVDVDGHDFSAMLIESATQPEWIQKGNSIKLVFKETEMSLGKKPHRNDQYAKPHQMHGAAY
ncbi:MAG TPA: hypothetical protein DHV48_16840 [Prolixibacteraceae bacterium]|nr:hypothetical protein [Prolixibacteraceae bacterium]